MKKTELITLFRETRDELIKQTNEIIALRQRIWELEAKARKESKCVLWAKVCPHCDRIIL